jgi:hypothetical protein
MATWTWIIIGIAAAAAIGLLAFYGLSLVGRRRVERRRAEAHVLRQEADERTRRAEEREAVAGHIAAEAREEREHAQKLEQRAGKLDPAKARVGREGEAQAKAERKPSRRVFSR